MKPSRECFSCNFFEDVSMVFVDTSLFGYLLLKLGFHIIGNSQWANRAVIGQLSRWVAELDSTIEQIHCDLNELTEMNAFIPSYFFSVSSPASCKIYWKETSYFFDVYNFKYATQKIGYIYCTKKMKFFIKDLFSKCD